MIQGGGRAEGRLPGEGGGLFRLNSHFCMRLLYLTCYCHCCMTWWMQTQTKRKGFNAAEARVADTGADQFDDAMRGAPKGEAGVIGSTRSTRKPAR